MRTRDTTRVFIQIRLNDVLCGFYDNLKFGIASCIQQMAILNLPVSFF